MQFAQMTHHDGINMTVLEIHLAVVKKLRELYPQSRAAYNINTRIKRYYENYSKNY